MEIQDLRQRLALLEHRQRMTLVAWLVSVIGLFALFAGAQRAPSQESVIKAREFDLVDETGRNRIIVGLDGLKRPNISFWDEGGHVRLGLGFPGVSRNVGDLGSDIEFYDTTGHTNLTLGFSGEYVSTTTGPTPALTLYGADHKSQAALGFGAERGTPQLTLSDARGANIYAGWSTTGEPVFALAGDDRVVRWHAP